VSRLATAPRGVRRMTYDLLLFALRALVFAACVAWPLLLPLPARRRRPTC
jgi:hypothetical protein